MIKRCKWCLAEPIYIKYHDNEWGVPVRSSLKWWENFLLESFQSDLSWIIILKKTESFRKSFQNFNPYKIANFNDKDIQELLKDDTIIKHKGKILATVNNAKVWMKIEKKIGFEKYVWSFLNYKPIQNDYQNLNEIPKNSSISIKLSKDI